MIKSSVRSLPLFFGAAFNLNPSKHALPCSFSLTAHSVEVPAGNLLQEVGVRLLRTDEGNADLHLHRLVARGVKGGVSADFSFVSSSHCPRFDATISPRTEGVERPVKLGGKVDGIRRLIPAADEIAAALDTIGRNDAHPAVNRVRIFDGVVSAFRLHYGTGINQYMR